MPLHLFYNPRIWTVAFLLTAIAVVHVADYGAMIDVPPAPRKSPTKLSVAQTGEVIDQYLGQYAFETYRNVIDDSMFAVNAVKKEPIKITRSVTVKKPPAPSKIKPFTVNLEVTGIAITPERKLVMIWDKGKQESQVLREHEKLYKWKVVSIDKQRVILRHERGGRYEFIVNEDTLAEF
jgi:type II secretory pathway component PulC